MNRVREEPNKSNVPPFFPRGKRGMIGVPLTPFFLRLETSRYLATASVDSAFFGPPEPLAVACE